MPITPLPDDFNSIIRDIRRRLAILESANPLLHAAVDDGTRKRLELGNLAAYTDPNGVVSPAQIGLRWVDVNGNLLGDTVGLSQVMRLLVEEALSPSTGAGSGTAWATVQTIPGSGSSFTLSRQGSILVLSTVPVAMTAGATNYMSLWNSVWQGGNLVARKFIGASSGFAQNIEYFITGAAIFTGLAGGTYQIRQEFALDAGTTACQFGSATIGFGPRADVLQMGG